MKPTEISQGQSPLILGMPHTGTYVPDDIFAQFTPLGQSLQDTDWHIHTLYSDLTDDITTVRATFHRYMIDANRNPSGASLYPGQNTTELCPISDFNGSPLYKDGKAPDAEEIARRLETFHAPYHAALRNEISRVKALHGFVILYDCHSIQSKLPYLFEGRLSDFNIGSFNGQSCAANITNAVESICAKAEGFTHVVNGRFKGGWTTRHYGKPEDNVHAIQMELTQRLYMSEAAPWDYDPVKAEQLRPHLKTILGTLKTIKIEVRK